MNLRDHINTATETKTAVGHFNASTVDGIWAIADAAFALKVPVIVGLSEGERDYVGVKEAVAVINSIRQSRGQPIFINADHTYSFERVKEAVDAGFDSVIFDGAKLSFEENVSITKKCVEYAKNNGNYPIIEGELGFVGSSSKVLDSVPAGVALNENDMTKPVDAEKFVRSTGVDLLAPAVGNVHGIIRGGEPRLNIHRIEEISQTIKVPLVLHGASGNSDDDITAAIKSGVAIVHVNTELRLAYRSALVKSLSEDHEEVSPYKYLKPAKLAMQKVVEDKLRIFNGI